MSEAYLKPSYIEDEFKHGKAREIHINSTVVFDFRFWIKVLTAHYACHEVAVCCNSDNLCVCKVLQESQIRTAQMVYMLK